MDKQMEKLTRKEIEEIIKDIDKQLFKKLFPLFEKMSKRGKDATIQTLIMILEMEV